MKKSLLHMVIVLILIGPLAFLTIKIKEFYNIKNRDISEFTYVPKDNPTAIHIKGEGFDKIVLKIDDLPKMSSIAKGMYISPLGFSYAVLSPDKKKIAFSVNAQHEWTGILDLKTREIKQLTFVGEGEAGKPIWSPNSRYIAIENIPASGLRMITVVDIKTGKHMDIFHKLHNRDEETYDPRWSEDSRHISFTSKKEFGETETYWSVDIKGWTALGGDASSTFEGFKSDYVRIKNIDKFTFIDLNGDEVEEVLLQAEGSVIKYGQETFLLINGYLPEDKEDRKWIMDKSYDKVFSIFYQYDGKWIPTLLGAYSSKSCVLPEEHINCNGLVAFEAFDILKNSKKQVKLNFTHAGEASGIDYYLFQFEGGKVDLLFHTWHDKYGGDTTYDIEKSKILEKRELYTPFQVPTHYHTSLWSYSILVWNSQNNRFEIEKEWMEWNRGENGFTLDPEAGCGDSSKAIFEAQERFKNGQEQWRGDLLESVKHYYPGFSEYTVTFNKNGLAIIRVRGKIDNKSFEARTYLYQPFYGVEDKSIWEEAYYGQSGMMGIVPVSVLSVRDKEKE